MLILQDAVLVVEVTDAFHSAAFGLEASNASSPSRRTNSIVPCQYRVGDSMTLPEGRGIAEIWAGSEEESREALKRWRIKAWDS
jgi:hypothetical protein